MNIFERILRRVRETIFVADPVSSEAREFIKKNPEFNKQVLKEIESNKPGEIFTIRINEKEKVELFFF